MGHHTVSPSNRLKVTKEARWQNRRRPAPRPRLCLTWASSDASLRLPTNDYPAYHSTPFIPHPSRHIHRQHIARPLCCQHHYAKETWRCGSFEAATLPLGDTQARFEMAVGTLAWAEGASWTEARGLYTRHWCLVRSILYGNWFYWSIWSATNGTGECLARCVASVELSQDEIRIFLHYRHVPTVEKMDNTDYRSGYRPLPIKRTDIPTIWPHGLTGEAVYPPWHSIVKESGKQSNYVIVMRPLWTTKNKLLVSQP